VRGVARKVVEREVREEEGVRDGGVVTVRREYEVDRYRLLVRVLTADGSLVEIQ